MTDKNFTRRDFLTHSLAAGSALVLGASRLNSQDKTVLKLGVFSKHLQWLKYEDTADAVAEIGWDGIECPVRPGGHVLPERVEDDLPKMVEALRKRNLEMLLMTTAIQSVSEPRAEKMLRTAAKLGIKTYRIGGWKYTEKLSVPDRLKEAKAQLRDLVALNKELGLVAAYQNHSGVDIGAPVWDIYELIKDLDTRYIGIAFDIGHATIEGGYGWSIQVRLMQQYFKSVIVKDYKWAKNEAGQWRAQWGNLGEGMISKSFFPMLKKADYQGPIIQHFEWEQPGDTEQEKHKNLLANMKRDCRTLKSWLKEAGL